MDVPLRCRGWRRGPRARQTRPRSPGPLGWARRTLAPQEHPVETGDPWPAGVHRPTPRAKERGREAQGVGRARV